MESMALDIAAACATSASANGTQTLAAWISILFSAYTLVAVALSTHAILFASDRLGGARPYAKSIGERVGGELPLLRQLASR